MTFANTVRSFVLALAALIAFASPARAEWLRAETEHFVIVGDTSRGEISEYARKVERFDALLRMFLPPANDDVIPPKLWIFLADGRDDLEAISPTVGKGVAGFYSRTDDRIFAVVDRQSSMGDTTLFHEYGHHFMFQYHNKAYPGWFVEGFAEYFAPSEMGMSRVKYGLYRPGRINSLIQTNNWAPMEDVLRSRLSTTSVERAAAYYAQAWVLTHYMIGDPDRQRQLSAYLAAVAGGEDPMDALEAHIGRTPEQLARELRSYLGRGITTYTLPEALPRAEVTVTSLSAGTGDSIWLDLRSTRSLGDDRDQLVAQAEAVAARYPGDRMAAVALAKILRRAEEPVRAAAVLEPVVAAHPEDAEARWLLASVLMDQADDATDDGARPSLMRNAARHLSAAYQADPLDFRVYMALARSRKGAANYPSDNDVMVLESAYRLAPQLSSTAYAAARVLMTRERYLEAVSVLRPMANNPHGGASLQPVRDLLAEASALAGLEPGTIEAPPEAVTEAEGEETAPPAP